MGEQVRRLHPDRTAKRACSARSAARGNVRVETFDWERMARHFASFRDQLPWPLYASVLSRNGVADAREIRSVTLARRIWQELELASEQLDES